MTEREQRTIEAAGVDVLWECEAGIDDHADAKVAAEAMATMREAQSVDEWHEACDRLAYEMGETAAAQGNAGELVARLLKAMPLTVWEQYFAGKGK